MLVETTNHLKKIERELGRTIKMLLSWSPQVDVRMLVESLNDLRKGISMVEGTDDFKKEYSERYYSRQDIEEKLEV